MIPAAKNANTMRLPDIQTELEIDDDRWKKAVPDLKTRLDALVRELFLLAELPKQVKEYAELSFCLVLTNDEVIQTLNRDYRGVDKPTNVLGFANIDSDDPPPPGDIFLLGDIFMAYETLIREAEEQEKTFANHFTHLLAHGLLHLLGYDHMEDNDAQRMEALEIAVLGKMSIANPYI